MQSELAKLLSISAERIDGLFVEVPRDQAAANLLCDFHFYHVRLQDGRTREQDVLQFLRSCIVPYCLNRKETDGEIQKLDVADLFIKARDKFQRSGDKKRNKGEPGELLAYALIEGSLGAPQVISKMALNTNPQMPVHGSDGVHLGAQDDGKFFLYFAESKLYGRYDQAVGDAMDSVAESLTFDETGGTPQEFEIDLVEDNLDIPEGEVRTQVINLLNPYGKEKDNLAYVHTCIIGFDMAELKSRVGDEIEEEFAAAAKRCSEYMRGKIEKDPKLGEERWAVFFVPFSSVEEFRNNFLKMLGI